MRLALELAEEAARDGEVPVGAVIVKGDEVISMGRNRREKEKNALCHAELEAINLACWKLGGWRLWECELYVTLEPCPMCTGAIINARIPKVYFGASDAKAGSCGSVADLLSLPYNHKAEVVPGLMEKECAEILRRFFSNLRERQKARGRVRNWKGKHGSALTAKSEEASQDKPLNYTKIGGKQ